MRTPTGSLTRPWIRPWGSSQPAGGGTGNRVMPRSCPSLTPRSLTRLRRHRAAGRGPVAAADQLAARGIDAIVTSPLQRARKTAEAVAAATGASLAVDDGLVEADFGKWEGLTFGEAAQRWPEEMSAWLASADVAPPGGESLADAARRVLGTLDRLLAARPRETLLLVSHVTPIKTLACRALLAPPAAMFRIHLDVASLTEIDWFADGPALVRSLNDTAHLRQPAR